MIEGSYHCGAVRWSFEGVPESAPLATAPSAAAMGRSGRMTTKTRAYGSRVRLRPIPGASTLGFHFCPGCGCVAYWRALGPGQDGRRRIAVNLRLAEPQAVGAIALDRFDGLGAFEDLPRDGRCVADMWF
jgi:hypothetical protein